MFQIPDKVPNRNEGALRSGYTEHGNRGGLMIRLRLATMFVFFSLCAGVAQTLPAPILVPVVDRSDTGSPISVAGNISLLETVRGSEILSSRGENVTARNIGNKPILTVVASLDEVGPHSGGNQTIVEIDRFFVPDILMPGEDFVLANKPVGVGHTVECCTNPLQAGRDPRAELRTLYVQFNDGSTFGDPKAGREVLARRAKAVHALHQVGYAYQEHGNTGFLDALRQEQSAKEPDGLCMKIYQEQRTHGTQAGIGMMQQILSVVSAHETMIR
jgi:hypothetical protein